jgi:cation diffusion facilitator family transporter
MDRPHKGLRATLIGIIVSMLLAIVKAVAGIFGSSYALIADAIESLTDVFSSAMLWIGLKWSAKPPDHNHPYGHGKGEALITLGIGLVLIAAAAVISFSSVKNIITPHKIPAPYTLVVLVVVILTKEVLYRFVLKTGEEISSGAVKADAFHHRSDAITSAVAFIGISIGLIGGPGYEVADDYAALLGSVVILYNAWRIIRPALGELLDEEPDPALNASVCDLAASVPGVEFVERCRIRKMGPLFLGDIHIWVDGNLSVEAGHRISHDVKDAIQAKYPLFADVMIHVEPSEVPQTGIV